ncbi:heparan-alpha-glucosaminide N-acetyltransferase-like [Tribolium madens]|uniref:heparan-alpha-glucosaminide N-acetyltransferase-like n=1 Tax=Tribolium madens TaxID=41895 RepID=UPI001CF73ADC|nr:heparan-alpha-glucosaminide N-acetyltransferase-like [Tribolium madens]
MTDLSWLEDYGQNDYKGYDMSLLKIDQAYLSINLEDPTATYRIFRKHVDCVKCPFVKLEDLETDDSILLDNTRLILNQTPNNLYRISTTNSEILYTWDKYVCEFGDEFGEFGIYEVNVTKANHCMVNTIKNAVSISFPVLTVFLIYCVLFLGVFGLVYLWKHFVNKNEIKEKKPEGKKRVKSLDTFRGISIVIMIFVNYGAGGYLIVDHASWNGLHIADLVFPWFMWIMGACTPISLTSSFKKQISNTDIFLNVLKRSIKLFCLGIFLGSGPTLECMRIFGVLQRFGICYLVVTTICLFLMKREFSESKHKIGKFVTDILILWKGWIVVLVILFVHCMVLFLLADEDCPRGYLGPGGLHDNGKYFNCTGGATGYIDAVILGKHRYQKPTSKEIYLGAQAFDPEGILGCLTSIVHVFIGVQAGITLLVYKEHSARLIRWLSWSVFAGIIGGALCGFSKEDGVIPVNKNLWSISFVLVTSCFAFLLLSICYVLIDVKNWWSGKPFLFAGMNAILLYIGHQMTYGHIPVRWLVNCDKDHGTHLIALFENLWGAGFWVVVAYYWYKINYFFTI